MAIAPPNNTRILLVCEGEKDRLFFRQFINQRGLHNLGIWVMPSRGNSRFRQVIESFEIEHPQRHRALRAILIVSDKDDVAVQRYDDVCDQIEQMRGAGTRPANQMAPSGGAPPIYILMLPTHQSEGHLESQCIQAARRADPAVATMTDNMAAIALIHTWQSQSRRDKAWLRINLAIRCPNPFVPLGDTFVEPRYQGLIPVGDTAFASIETAIRSLP